MAFQRKTTNVATGEFEIQYADGVWTIPDICVHYFVGLTDTFIDVTDMPEFVVAGTELGGSVPAGLSGWAAATAYVANDLVLHPTEPNRILQRLADGTSGATFDGAEEVAWGTFLSGSLGLYCVSWTLRKLGQDANSAWWEQVCKVSTIQPKRLAENPDPVARGVRRLPRTRRFIEHPTLMDAMGNGVVNSAGDAIAGFSVDIPVWTYNFEINLSQYESWLDLDGYVNDNEIELPLTYRDASGNVTTTQTVTIPTGTGRLLIDEVPVEISVANGVPHLYIKFALEVNPRGWTVPVINQGTSELTYQDSLGNTITDTAIIQASGPGVIIGSSRIMDKNGEPVAEAEFLDEFGRHNPVARPDGRSVGTVSVDAQYSTAGQFGTYRKLNRTIITSTCGYQFTGAHVGQGVVLRRQTDGVVSESTIIQVISATQAKVFEGAWPSQQHSNGNVVAWDGFADLHIPGMSILNRFRFPVGDLTSVPF